MSGGNLPYHLRVKKEIERRLFVEQLRLISKIHDFEEYAYIGMAGPFSEDFKIMYDRFNFKHFFSYETEESVYKRQSFNIPFTHINYINNKISTVLDQYPQIGIKDSTSAIEASKAVLWLDYTGFDYQLLNDFERAITTLESGSVIKITLLAHVSKFYSSSTEPMTIVREKRVKKINDALGENYFLTDVFTQERMTEKDFPLTIFELLKKISYSALRGGKTKFLPISSYIYQDGMTMITFTGMIINQDQEDTFLQKTGLKEWIYGLQASPLPLKIEVPFLSLKEKLNLDACLPNNPSNLDYFEGLEFQSYEKFHRFYPTYAKIF